jgi:hypothetical protein
MFIDVFSFVFLKKEKTGESPPPPPPPPKKKENILIGDWFDFTG